MVHIQELEGSVKSTEDSASTTAEDSPGASTLDPTEDTKLVPDFIGRVLCSSDGKIAVPFLSRMYNWSFNVTWLSRVDPSTWLYDSRMKLLVSPNPRQSNLINNVIAPLMDFLVYKNNSMVEFINDSPTNQLRQLNDTSSSYRVQKAVVDIAFKDVKKLEDIGGGTTSDIFYSVCTTHILTQLLDKLIWASDLRKKGSGPTIICLDDADSEVEEPLALDYPCGEGEEQDGNAKINAVLEWYNAVHVNWRNVVEAFIVDWEGSQAMRDASAVPSHDASAAGTSSAKQPFLAAMYNHAKLFQNSSNVSTALSRISDAVLALASLRLFDLDAALARKSKKQEFKFHEALLNASGSADTRKPLQNAKFMRALYAIAVVGPISVLNADLNISPHYRGGFSLTQLTQSSVLGVKDISLERIFIEADLLNLLMDAAAEGVHIITERLSILVPRWKETLGLTKPSPSTSIPFQSQESLAPSPTKRMRLQSKNKSKTVVRDVIKKAVMTPVNPKRLVETIEVEVKNSNKRSSSLLTVTLKAGSSSNLNVTMDGNKLSFSAFEDERNQAKGKDQSKGKGKAKPRKSRSTTNRCNSEESDQDQYWTSMEEYETDEDEGARRIPFRRTEKKGKSAKLLSKEGDGSVQENTMGPTAVPTAGAEEEEQSPQLPVVGSNADSSQRHECESERAGESAERDQRTPKKPLVQIRQSLSPIASYLGVSTTNANEMRSEAGLVPQYNEQSDEDDMDVSQTQLGSQGKNLDRDTPTQTEKESKVTGPPEPPIAGSDKKFPSQSAPELDISDFDAHKAPEANRMGAELERGTQMLKNDSDTRRDDEVDMEIDDPLNAPTGTILPQRVASPDIPDSMELDGGFPDPQVLSNAGDSSEPQPVPQGNTMTDLDIPSSELPGTVSANASDVTETQNEKSKPPPPLSLVGGNATNQNSPSFLSSPIQTSEQSPETPRKETLTPVPSAQLQIPTRERCQPSPSSEFPVPLADELDRLWWFTKELRILKAKSEEPEITKVYSYTLQVHVLAILRKQYPHFVWEVLANYNDKEFRAFVDRELDGGYLDAPPEKFDSPDQDPPGKKNKSQKKVIDPSDLIPSRASGRVSKPPVPVGVLVEVPVKETKTKRKRTRSKTKKASRDEDEDEEDGEEDGEEDVEEDGAELGKEDASQEVEDEKFPLLPAYSLYTGPAGTKRVYEGFLNGDPVYDKPYWTPEKADAPLCEDNKLSFPYFEPVVHGTGIRWKKSMLDLPIPIAQLSQLLNLRQVYDSMSDRHSAETFELDESDPIRVFPQEVWHKMTLEERQKHFSEKHVHVVNDRESGRPHPFPIFSGIKEWDEGQIGSYFDVFGHRFMHDQTWYPSGEFPALQKKGSESKTGAKKANAKASSSRKPAKTIPVSDLDDGRFTASKAWFEGPLPTPRHPDLVEVAQVDEEKFPELSEPRNEWPEPYWFSDGLAIDETVKAKDLKVNANLRLRAAQIEQFLFNRTRRSRFHDGKLKPAVVNFLDIPMSASSHFAIPVDGLDPYPNLQDHNLPDYTFATKYPHEDFRWGLLASAGAISDTHIDAAGFATVVRVVLGKKLWFVAYPDNESPKYAFCDAKKESEFFDCVDGEADEDTAKQFPKTKDGRWKRPLFMRKSPDGRMNRSYLSVEGGFEDRGLNFMMVVLNEGDDFYMHPGTPHMVVSTQDSLAGGGHFYCPALLRKTIKALVLEQSLGTLVTNTSHSQCGILFLKMMSHAKLVLERYHYLHNLGYEVDETRGYGTLRVPTTREVADLIVLVCYLDQLDPAEIQEDEELADDSSTDDEVESKFFYPKGRLVTFDKEADVLNVNWHRVNEVWQKSAAGRRDIYHTVTVIVKNFLENFEVPSSLVEDLIVGERYLLAWANSVYDQLTARSEYYNEPPPSRRIERSQFLADFIERLNDDLEEPFETETEPLNAPATELLFFKEEVLMGLRGKKRKAGKATKQTKKQKQN